MLLFSLFNQSPKTYITPIEEGWKLVRLLYAAMQINMIPQNLYHPGPRKHAHFWVPAIHAAEGPVQPSFLIIVLIMVEIKGLSVYQENPVSVNIVRVQLGQFHDVYRPALELHVPELQVLGTNIF